MLANMSRRYWLSGYFFFYGNTQLLCIVVYTGGIVGYIACSLKIAVHYGYFLGNFIVNQINC